MSLRVALVGCGGIGREHLAAYRELSEMFQVVALCDSDVERAQALAGGFAGARATADLAELCRRADVDVIDLCTPPYLHYAQMVQALDAAKHVICEKPLAGSLRAVDDLLRREASAGRRVMPIFQGRFGHGVQKLGLLRAAGVTGRAYVSSASVFWRRGPDYYATWWRGRWRTDLGGTLAVHAIHALDLLTCVLGPARSVFARTATLVNPIETEDCATVALEMADGSLAGLTATTGSPALLTQHRFCFQNLTAESNTRPYNNSGDPWTFTPDTPEAAAQIEATLARFAPLPEGFSGQFARFYTALQDGSPLPVSLADARQSVELLTAIYYSARTGQAVTLPIGPDHPYYGGWAP